VLKDAIISNRAYIILVLVNFVLNYMSIFSLYSYIQYKIFIFVTAYIRVHFSDWPNCNKKLKVKFLRRHRKMSLLLRKIFQERLLVTER